MNETLEKINQILAGFEGAAEYREHLVARPQLTLLLGVWVGDQLVISNKVHAAMNGRLSLGMHEYAREVILRTLQDRDALRVVKWQVQKSRGQL